MGDDNAKAKLEALRAQIEKAKDEKNEPDSPLTESGVAKKEATSVKVKRVLKGHFGKVYAMHWAGAEHSERLVSASQDGKLIVWNAQTTNKTQAIPLRSSWVMTCAYEQEGNRLVGCGGLDNLCSIYSVESGDNPHGKAEKELAHHDGYLSCCRFVNNSEIITSSGDSTCILWDLSAMNPKCHFSVHTSDVMSIALSPTDENVFVSGSCDATCIAWDKRSAKVINNFKGHESDINSVAFFPDGKCFGTGSDDSSCRMFDLRCFGQVAELATDKILCGVTSVSFTKSGRFLFGGYDDYKCYIWDTLTSEYSAMSFHENRVSCLGTETQGRAVATGSWDTILKVLA